MKIKLKHFLNLISVLFIIFLLYLAIHGYRMGIFTSLESLQEFLKQYGYRAPLVFILLQIAQIVLPIIPGGVSTALGVIMFGPFCGFIYNYIGVSIGSIIVFAISKHFGKKIILSIFGQDSIQKYDKRLNSDKYNKFFAIAILIPGAPDDFLCYLSGLTDMTFREFVLIILLCKPPSIFLYSMALKLGITTVFKKFA
jgi:uncharacterized membrane protein YdjX (TVP38/TMEM64 family)